MPDLEQAQADTAALLQSHREAIGQAVEQLKVLRRKFASVPVYPGDKPTDRELLRDEVVDHYSNAIARLNEARAHLAMAAKPTAELLASVHADMRT